MNFRLGDKLKDLKELIQQSHPLTLKGLGLPNLPPLRVSSSAPVTPPLSSPTASQAPKIRKPD
ncbi:hypothetical protein [Oryza sativa Japonica Group]|uniref:Uncharacterized protein n=1 Tax=Oryza sativa subsp. japonica TaxID=39947 RepID=Q5JNL5_ORYSJ|nr:hypothetical protein [Oryza sativa Japonica Group]